MRDTIYRVWIAPVTSVVHKQRFLPGYPGAGCAIDPASKARLERKRLIAAAHLDHGTRCPPRQLAQAVDKLKHGWMFPQTIVPSDETPAFADGLCTTGLNAGASVRFVRKEALIHRVDRVNFMLDMMLRQNFAPCRLSHGTAQLRVGHQRFGSGG